MRKAFAILIAILITVQAWSASVTGGKEVMPGLFYSEEELSHISFSDELTDSERDYYDSIDIKLITAAPAEPVYIYFGHSGLSVSVPGTEPVVFDYGTFSFSESFYHDFIFGLLYLAYCQYMARRGGDNINHSAHFYGAVFGFIFPAILHPQLIRAFLSHF